MWLYYVMMPFKLWNIYKWNFYFADTNEILDVHSMIRIISKVNKQCGLLGGNSASYMGGPRFECRPLDGLLSLFLSWLSLCLPDEWWNMSSSFPVHCISLRVVPWLKRLFAVEDRDQTPPIHVGFVVDKITLRQIFLRVFRCFPSVSFPLLSSLIYSTVADAVV